MTSADPAARPSSWVVVGLDNGGTTNNATVLDAGRRRSSSTRWSRCRAGWSRDPQIAVDAMVAGARDRARCHRDRRAPRCARSGLDTPGPGQRRRGHLVPRRHQLLRPRVVGLRHPRRARGAARPARRLQQRRQRGRPLRPPRALRCRGVPPVVGLGDRRHRARRRCRRARSGRAGRGRDGRRARARADPDGRPARAGPADCRMCNCGFAGDVESVASLTGIEKNLLPYWLSRYPDHALAALADRPGRQGGARPRRRRGTSWRCKVFEQQAMALGRLFTHRRELHRPARLLRRRRGGRGRAGTSATGSSTRWSRPPTLRAEQQSGRRRSRWSRTSTWPAPAAPPWPRSPWRPASRPRRRATSSTRASGSGWGRADIGCTLISSPLLAASRSLHDVTLHD